MNKFLMSAAVAASAILPSAALAQALPPAVISIVDLGKVTSECNACKTATATLRSQAQAIQTRERTLSQQLETEGKALQAEIDALQGAAPSAALQAKVTAFQNKQKTALEEVQRGQANVQRNTAYVQQQVGQKLGPIYQQVMQRRGATVMLESDSTLASSAAIDVSAEVLAALNAAMPTLATQAPAPTTPQGR